MIKKEVSRPDRRLRGVVEDFRVGCETYIRLVRDSPQERKRIGETRLDKERNRMLLKELENMIKQARKIKRYSQYLFLC